MVSAPGTKADSESLFAHYRPLEGVYDEMWTAAGELRPHWRQLGAALEELGPAEIQRRWDQARRMIHENGVTYNVHGESHGMDRPWELDPLPLVISAADGALLSSGLTQRARLLNHLLADLYGPQESLKAGLIPPEMLYSHPGFLRPCHGLAQPGRTFLHMCASSLVRSSQGAWCVMADAAQASAGAGYAIENRLVISRMLSEAFHECQVQRLAPFFAALRDTLQSLAARDEPTTVLLSPGPGSPTYFEDAYLARYLGYTLAEGGDLTVRLNRVYLKTLGGLIRVDVILRRIADQGCDPLELVSKTGEGVAGLLQAARDGNVVIANMPGSGLVEGPALLSLLPRLCRHFLGEELQIASLPTWWCGDRASLDYVLEHLDEMVIKSAFTTRGNKRFGWSLSRRDRAELVERIKAAPREYVGQSAVVPSTAPVWAEGGLQPGKVLLRMFAVASGDSYQIMPGALGRISLSTAGQGTAAESLKRSKEVWLLSEGPVQPVSLLPPAGQPVMLRRSGNELPSRVADHLFWLGRHVERAEGAVRLLRSILARLTGELQLESRPELPVLLQALDTFAQLPESFTAAMDSPGGEAIERELLSLIFSENRADSLRKTLATIVQMASVVRDRISIDAWRILARVSHDSLPVFPLGVIQLSEVQLMLNHLIVSLSAFSGLGMESTTRGPAWRFLDMGRRIERALHTVCLLRNTLLTTQPDEGPVIEAVLEVCDSLMTYRSRYLTHLQAPPVVDLLVVDETNPRSVAFQLVALSGHADQLPYGTLTTLLSTEQRAIMSALSAVRLAEIDRLCMIDDQQRRSELEQFFSDLEGQLWTFAEALNHDFFFHAGRQRQMSQSGGWGA
ncbi:MAG: circularly permuted type 2 ATP-grasp protein [Planctomycetes bacterium]|nr:circularly permuted type 2 ATP-grasp protein [Planctomycetota bacterium]